MAFSGAASHVLDHAAAKRADLSHRKTSCLRGWAVKTLNSQRGGDQRDRFSTVESVGSFNLGQNSFGPTSTG
jgi:hypothetical protein